VLYAWHFNEGFVTQFINGISERIILLQNSGGVRKNWVTPKSEAEFREIAFRVCSLMIDVGTSKLLQLKSFEYI
jgi:hypothetical protein